MEQHLLHHESEMFMIDTLLIEEESTFINLWTPEDRDFFQKNACKELHYELWNRGLFINMGPQLTPRIRAMMESYTVFSDEDSSEWKSEDGWTRFSIPQHPVEDFQKKYGLQQMRKWSAGMGHPELLGYGCKAGWKRILYHLLVIQSKIEQDDFYDEYSSEEVGYIAKELIGEMVDQLGSFFQLILEASIEKGMKKERWSLNSVNKAIRNRS